MASPNILCIILDSVRARNTSLHGYGRCTTPFLEKFADQSTVYTQARSPSIHSISSHASIFSGYHVEEHNVVEHESKLDPAVNLWKQLANNYGYSTGIFSPNMVVMGSSNLAEAFQTQEGPRRNRLFPTAFSPGDTDGNSYINFLLESLNQDQKLKSILNGVYGILPYTKLLESHDPDAESADVYIDLFLDWIENQSSSWAACLNLMDAHYPYIPEREFDLWGGDKLIDIQNQMRTPSQEILSGKPIGEFQALESIYDGCIRQLDYYLEYLVDSLKANEDFENTFLVITSDHGEGFAEQSNLNRKVELIDHSWGISEVLTHVPLVVNYPGQTSGKTVDELASLTEFKRVTEQLLAGDPEPDFTPKEADYILASTYRIRDPKNELPSECENKERYEGPWRAVYTREYQGILKHVSRNKDQAVINVTDPQSTYRVNDGDVKVNEIYDNLNDVGVNQGTVTIRGETEQRLKDLGYMR